MMDKIFLYKKWKIKNLTNDFQSIVKTWSGVWGSPRPGKSSKKEAETKILAACSKGSEKGNSEES